MKFPRGFDYQVAVRKLRPDLVETLARSGISGDTPIAVLSRRVVTCSDLFPSWAYSNPPTGGERRD